MRNYLGAGKHFLVFPVRGGELLNYVGFITTDEATKESWSQPGDAAYLAREFAGWDPLVGAIIAQIKTTFRWGLYDREPLARYNLYRITGGPPWTIELISRGLNEVGGRIVELDRRVLTPCTRA